MYVAQYEARPDPAKPLRAPGKLEAASLNTHDMPMWATFWDGLDIADRQDLGLLTSAQARKEQQHRRKLRAALVRFLRRKKMLRKTGRANSEAVLAALLRWMGKSDAALVLVNLEDLWLETKPQNTPGTSTERVNWRRKLSRSVEQVRNSRNARALLRQVSAR
jgi:4-alpha-glucanotransferase